MRSKSLTSTSERSRVARGASLSDKLPSSSISLLEGLACTFSIASTRYVDGERHDYANQLLTSTSHRLRAARGVII